MLQRKIHIKGEQVFPERTTMNNLQLKRQKIRRMLILVPVMVLICTLAVHTGLGRFVKPSPDHLQIVSEILDACPNWYADLSWDLVQTYIVDPNPGMQSFDDWANFVRKYKDRLLWGSDTVINTKNKTDDKGNPFVGKEMPIADYLAVADILKPLWKKVGPDVSHKVRIANHLCLFDAARVKVRAWEALHAKDNVWNMNVQ